MVWTKYQIFLVALLVISGSGNTLLAKWMGRARAPGLDGVERGFDHWFTQTWDMFIGMTYCLLIYKIVYYRTKKRGGDEAVASNALVRGNKEYKCWVLLFPAMCDMCASCLDYIALLMTFASSYQMLRGSAIVFVASLSMIFLHRRITLQEWAGMLLVIIGLLIIGLTDFFFTRDSQSTDYNPYLVAAGDVLLIIAEFIQSIQVIYEETKLSKLDINPLEAAGWEGLFGFVVVGLLHIPMYFIPMPAESWCCNSTCTAENILDAFLKIGRNWQIGTSFFAMQLTIMFFNASGLGITKELSGTTKTILNNLRTIIIWCIALMLGWQEFYWPQVIGFIFLISGVFIYNDILVPQVRKCCRKMRNRSEEQMQAAPGAVAQ